ncbi:PREDICTED: proteasome assembly chaperone 3-like [Priapulus caudatus]|uniref:Proteasome assembly chaperone 3-like n=1 Tax=Priapulus caudatus TaxID=37621 RepID=A0ABM1DQL0_PRICU|nr:PREDICTED: proteasome assembly chaperone 3-like [Priapulus caudatus]
MEVVASSAAFSDSVLKNKQISAKVQAIDTDIVCTAFADKTFIIVTQLGKIGGLILVTKDNVVGDCKEPTFSVRVLLGKDDAVHCVIARRIAAVTGLEKPVLVALALKDTSVATARELEELVRTCSVW